MSFDLQYPIGPYTPAANPAAARASVICRLQRVPGALRLAVVDLAPSQLDTPYRPGGWTVRQVVHHVADSHMNFYMRLKLAMTEANPVVRPYEEQRWAELPDVAAVPIGVSLTLLDGVHERADQLLRAMSDADFQRTYVHPASGQHTVDYLIGMYAWHGEHHVAHVTALRTRAGWAS